MKTIAATYLIPWTEILTSWLVSSRTKLGLTQRALCDKLGIGQTFLSMSERGDRETMDVVSWKKIYAFLLEQGATPLPPEIDPIASMPSGQQLRKDLLEMKKATKGQLGPVVGVQEAALNKFLKGGLLKPKQHLSLCQGLKRLRSKTQSLQKEGLLPTPPPKSIIVKAEPVETKFLGPTLEELDAREFALIQRIRERLTTTSMQPTLNGKRH